MRTGASLGVGSLFSLQQKLLWIFRHKFLCRYILLFLLDEHIDMELMGHMVKYIINFIRNCQTIFQNSCTFLHFLPATYENSIHSNGIVSLLNFNHSSAYVAYLFIVVLICISLMSNDIGHLFMSLLAIYIYLLWWICLLKPFTCLKKIWVFHLLIESCVLQIQSPSPMAYFAFS